MSDASSTVPVTEEEKSKSLEESQRRHMTSTLPVPKMARQVSFFPLVTFDTCDLSDANRLLVLWAHKMGAVLRGNQSAVCHVLNFNGEPRAVTTAHTLIMPRVGNCPWLARENTIELSRLCAERTGLCRVALRLWREFVFPSLRYEWAMSYQDADLHNGNTYRFDGWERVGRSRSGPDTRSGREGRDKWVWAWPPRTKHQDVPSAEQEGNDVQ